MIFPTPEFTFFFLAFLAFYALFAQYKSFTYTSPQSIERYTAIAQKKRIDVLCIFNILFYLAYSPKMLVYLLGIVSVVYFAGKYLKTIPAIIAFLVFQIFYWKMVEAKYIIGFNHWSQPLGVSFFTFQALTYLFALKHIPKSKPELHLNDAWRWDKLLAFIGFFPTVFSGPILRSAHWSAELKKEWIINRADFHQGLTLIFMGCVYKLWIASLLHSIAANAWSDPAGSSVIVLWQGFYAYGLEIFHDFAGYSLMSLGIAKMFGFNIPANFNAPYFSQSVQEFWTRWHISLSQFFRDYVYIPLGGSQRGGLFQLRNVFIVMLISGLWHGLNSNYIVWAGLHILGICVAVMWKLYIAKKKTQHSSAGTIDGIKKISVIDRIKPYLFWFFTLHYVFIAWVFFRSPDAQTGVIYIQNMFLGVSGQKGDVQVLFWLLAGLAMLVQYKENSIIQKINSLEIKNHAKWIAFWILMFLAVLIFAPSGTPPFIYFQY